MATKKKHKKKNLKNEKKKYGFLYNEKKILFLLYRLNKFKYFEDYIVKLKSTYKIKKCI